MATRWTSKHTGQKIDDTIDSVCNPNLLDNWYFGNPVNQKGQTRYTGVGYTIDRWALSSSTTGSFILHGSDNYSADVKGTFYQRIENKRFIVGAKYTLSVLRGLITSPTLYHETFTLTASVGWKLRFNVNGGTFGFYYGQNTSDIQFDLDDVKSIIAAKLELGSQQTLAHQDENGVWQLNEIPDYGEQLARCQRNSCILFDLSNYGRVGLVVAEGSDIAHLYIPTPVTMRAIPSIQFLHGSISDLYLVRSGVYTPISGVSCINKCAGYLDILLNTSGLTEGNVYTVRVKENRVCILAISEL